MEDGRRCAALLRLPTPHTSSRRRLISIAIALDCLYRFWLAFFVQQRSSPARLMSQRSSFVFPQVFGASHEWRGIKKDRPGALNLLSDLRHEGYDDSSTNEWDRFLNPDRVELPPAVFQRNGNLFFHTTAQKVTSYKQTKNRKLMAFMIFAIFMLTINGVLSKSRRPISEMEIWEKKNRCYADIESGLWGEKCKTSMVAKENCALQCLSPVCYELIYESDPVRVT